MMNKKTDIPCVVLAGGLGTRLQSTIRDVVKPMAPMGNKPFLHILMDHLYAQGINKFVLALGYKSETVLKYFDALPLPYTLQYSIESEPLGTGGALEQALNAIPSNEVLVINGDTFFDLSISQFIEDARSSGNSFFMALKDSSDKKRFGNVLLQGQQVVAFNRTDHGGNLQNAGIYWLNKAALLPLFTSGPCSLEHDLFPKLIANKQLAGKSYLGFFIDMGIPEDYFVAQNNFARFYIDESWTLFLDRDGVINERIVGDYVKHVASFKFIEGALETIVDLSKLFGRILVVTNQQGIGKGLMTRSNLEDIHRYMCSEVEKKGGRIDSVYFASELAKENSNLRKPNPGMAHLARIEFPEIDFQKSVMVGDSDSDVLFGQALGMITVKLNAHEASTSKPMVRRKDLKACLNLFEKRINRSV